MKVLLKLRQRRLFPTRPSTNSSCGRWKIDFTPDRLTANNPAMSQRHGSLTRTDHPTVTQPGVPNRCELGQVSVSRFVAHIVAPFRMTLAYPIAGMHAGGPSESCEAVGNDQETIRESWRKRCAISRTSEPLTFWARSSICSGKDHLSQRQRSNRQEDSRYPSGSLRFYQWRDDREIPCVFPTRG